MCGVYMLDEKKFFYDGYNNEGSFLGWLFLVWIGIWCGYKNKISKFIFCV